MLKLDSHQHFWRFDPVRDAWIDDDMRAIQRDFLPEDLKSELDKQSIDGCVAVQSDQSEADNAFLIELASMHPFIKGIVGWVDLQAENVEESLQFYSQYKIMRGFRHVLQGEPNRALMLEPAFKQGIGLLERFGFTYDLLIFRDQLSYASELCASFPEQSFVLDHIAKPDIRNQTLDDWIPGIKSLSGNANVHCKVSGMVTEANWQNWKNEDFYPYLDVIFESFGIERLMFGSDWPVCNVAGGYTRAVGILKSYLSQFPDDQQALFWGGNAARFYGID